MAAIVANPGNIRRESEREKVEGKPNESRANIFLSVNDHRVVAFKCVFCVVSVPLRWMQYCCANIGTVIREAELFNLDVFVYVMSMSSIQKP